MNDDPLDIKGFDPGFEPIDAAFIQRMMALTGPLVRYFRTTVEGSWRIPREGGCLFVGNHAVFALDSMALFPALYMETGRLLRGLGDHNLFKVPLLNRLMVRVGAVDGSRENAARLLEAGQWVICYPGGARDALKPATERYRLRWHGRTGYLRVALMAGVPIIPIAGIGIDDAYVTLGHEKRLGRRLFGKKSYDLPILMGIGPVPLPVKFRFVVGEPIDPVRFGLSARDAEGEEERLLPAHTAIWSQTQGLIDRELGRRKSRFF